jgi:D-beta-D-heptose 7-phosphate kinase/D-beta-D-heptose 1-phosphate adenosyltransferase
MTAALDRRRLERVLDGFTRVRLLVVGDVLLDEYLWGEVDRVSPEAPVPVVHVRRESVVLGGAGNVVRNVVALGGGCALCSVVGDDEAAGRVRDALEKLGVDPRGLVVVPGRPTIRKTRVIARSQQIVRFDRETAAPIPMAAARRLISAIEDALPDLSGVVLEDYAKGTLAPGVAASAMRRFRAREIPVAVDPKTSLSPYRGATLVKPNLREAEILSGVTIRSDADLAKAAARLRRRIGGGAVAVTRGGEGMTLFEGEDALDVRTVQREVFDVQGAGDTTIAALWLARLAGATLFEAAVIANAAAGVVVGKIGTATAGPEEVRALLPEAIDAARAGLRRPAARRGRGA